MNQDLAFIESEVHRHLLREVLDRASGDEAVTGVLLAGSVAQGDAYPGSDLDVYVLLRDGCSRPFDAEVRQGIVVERSYADFDTARDEIEHHPMCIYTYLDGRILHDPQGQLCRLVELARTHLASYRAPAKERRRLAYWLKSARSKMVAALEAGDRLQAAYVASTNSWPILEGLWAVNDRPMPPNGAVRAHIRDLEMTPPLLEELWYRLFAGDALERIRATVEFMDWIIPVLEE